MELEGAIKQCKKFIKAFKKDDTKSVIGFDVQAMETLLQTLGNSIPKKKIEDKIKAYEKLIDDISESERYSHEIPLYKHDIQVLQELLEE